MEDMLVESKPVKALNGILNRAIYIVLILLLLYAGCSLWDIYNQYYRVSTNEQILHLKPGAPQYDFTDLLEINGDVQGWLTIDGTKIDYPVLQGTDNSEYLEKDLFKKYYVGGSVFLDYRCSSGFADNYNLVHGHHMDGGAMFGDLGNFEEESYFQAHETGTLYTPETKFELSIFACMQVDAYDMQIYQPMNHSIEAQQKLLDYIKDNAVQYRSNTDVTADDKIVVFSTCSSAFTNSRTVVVAKMNNIGYNREGEIKNVEDKDK